MQVIKEKILTVNQAHELLKERQKAGNLSYEQQNTLNYLEDLVKLNDKTSEKMLEELVSAGLTEWQAVKMVDILPKKEEQVKAILSSSGAIEGDAVKKAFEILKKYKKDFKEPAKTKKVEVIQQEKPIEETTEEDKTDN